MPRSRFKNANAKLISSLDDDYCDRFLESHLARNNGNLRVS